MPTRTTTREPKLLYRRLDHLFARTDGHPAVWLKGTFLDGLFEILRDELNVLGARLYVEGRGGWTAVRTCGECHGAQPLALEPDALDIHRAFAEPVSLIEPPEAADVAGRLGISSSRLAFLCLGAAPNRRLLAFCFADDWPRERVEFTLHAVRSALDARLVEARRSGTMREAAEIQRSLLLERAPEFAGYDLACRSSPAEEVGGDFYDFDLLESELLALSIGDASGHGLQAALLVRDVVTGLRMGVRRDLKATSVIRRLNRVIHRSNLSSRFVSVFYGELEANGSLIYVTAGHPPPFLLLPDRVEELSVGGTLLGPIPDARFTRGFAHLDRGAVLVMYTDGMIERGNLAHRPLRDARLQRIASEHRGESAAAILDAIFEAARAWGGRHAWEDDATAVVIRRIG